MSRLFFIIAFLCLTVPATACPECEAYYAKAMEYKAAKNYLEAWRNLDKAMKLEPDNFEYQKQMADIQFLRRSYYDAAQLNDIVLQKEPNNLEALCRAAKIKLNYNRYDEAIEAATKALAITDNNNTNNELQLILGNAYYAKNYYPQCISALKKLNTGVTQKDVLYKIAKSYEGLNNYKEAIPYYIQLVGIDTLKYNYVLELAAAYYSAEQYDMAITQYLKAKEKGCPGDLNYYNTLASCYFDKKDFKSAAENFDKAKTFSPYDSDIRFMIAQSYMNLGDFKTARVSIEEYLALYPEDADMVYMLGMTYLRQDNMNKAEQYFNKAFAMKPELAKLKQARIRF